MAYTKRPHTSNGKSADNKKSRSPQKKSRAEVITYRLESEMVYVEPADTMEVSPRLVVWKIIAYLDATGRTGLRAIRFPPACECVQISNHILCQCSCRDCAAQRSNRIYGLEAGHELARHLRDSRHCDSPFFHCYGPLKFRLCHRERQRTIEHRGASPSTLQWREILQRQRGFPSWD